MPFFNELAYNTSVKLLFIILLLAPSISFAENTCFLDVSILDSGSGIKRAAINISTIKFFYPLRIKVTKNNKTVSKEITMFAFGNDIKEQNRIDASYDQVKSMIQNCQKRSQPTQAPSYKRQIVPVRSFVQPKPQIPLKQTLPIKKK
jgi:hypothetical protein